MGALNCTYGSPHTKPTNKQAGVSVPGGSRLPQTRALTRGPSLLHEIHSCSCQAPLPMSGEPGNGRDRGTGAQAGGGGGNNDVVNL
jgi:hypothetical protein